MNLVSHSNSSSDSFSDSFSMKDFNISIPDELIAQYPAEKREESCLLVLYVSTGKLVDDVFKNIGRYLEDNDCIVYNNARVIHARLYGRKIDTGGKLEILLTQKINDSEWLALTSPYKRAKRGIRVKIESDRDIFLEVLERLGDGICRIRFSEPVNYETLRDIGRVPLPKYIKREPVPGLDDKRYQTVYSEKNGAVASPTAGLHFTVNIIDELKKRGILFVPVTLYVDWGTFKPVREEDYRKHKIHSERYEISEKSAETINRCRKEGRRIVCVGTTSVRALESASDNSGFVKPVKGETDLYIYPGYRFKVVDALITNFHMPDSTLILLVSAFAGRQNIIAAYRHAIENKYRFFSYGDAMFIIKNVRKNIEE